MGKARPGSGHRVQRPRKSDHKSKLHQESEQARPSERLRQEGKKRSAHDQETGPPREPSEAGRVGRGGARERTKFSPQGGNGVERTLRRRKLRMGAAQEKLAAQAPVKPPGPVKRGAGALGWGLHGFVHGKVYEVEHENVGTEGAHHSELVGEEIGRASCRERV